MSTLPYVFSQQSLLFLWKYDDDDDDDDEIIQGFILFAPTIYIISDDKMGGGCLLYQSFRQLNCILNRFKLIAKSIL